MPWSNLGNFRILGSSNLVSNTMVLFSRTPSCHHLSYSHPSSKEICPHELFRETPSIVKLACDLQSSSHQQPFSFIHLLIYIAHLLGNYSEVLPTPARSKRTVFNLTSLSSSTTKFLHLSM